MSDNNNNNNKVKIVGIPGHMLTNDVFGAGANHMEYIRSFGAIPRILSPGEPVATDIAMLYLPGGPDINPTRYGDVPGYKVRHADMHNEWFFEERLPRYVDIKIPIVGVCLGMQQIQTLFGGKLLQDMPAHPQSHDRWLTAHDVWDVHTGDCYEVNSHHHQGVRTEAPGFIVDLVYSPLKNPLKRIDGSAGYTLRNKAHSVVEAMHHSELPIWAVQFHPEEMHDEPYMRSAIRTLLDINIKKGREETVA